MDSRQNQPPALLGPSDWLSAALLRFANHGVDSVRVEVLARDLGVSKGSFYWHFQDRRTLLEEMLALWQARELEWLGGGPANEAAAERWARVIGRMTESQHVRLEVAVRAWAQSDPRVARRVATLERRRAAVFASVLRDVGFTRAAAEAWSDVVLLVCLGWLDRAARDNEFLLEGRSLGDILSEVVLAASAGSSTLQR